MTYKKTATNLLPLYSELINKYQILIYSGDTDACVPYVGTEAWTRGLNFTVVNDWFYFIIIIIIIVLRNRNVNSNNKIAINKVIILIVIILIV